MAVTAEVFYVTFKYFKTYWRRKHEFPVLFSQPEHQHLKIIRLQYPRETNAWLGKL